MGRLADASAVQTFIGLGVIFLNFFKTLQKCESLTRKNAEWIWTHEHKDAFEKIKGPHREI